MTCSKEILLGTEYTALNGAYIYHTACSRPPLRKRGPVKKEKEVDVVSWKEWTKIRKKKKVSLTGTYLLREELKW
jgi:hypothetical protein